MLCQWFICTFCFKAKDSRKAQKIIDPDFDPTQIAVISQHCSIVLTVSVSILPFQSGLGITILLAHRSRELCPCLLFSFAFCNSVPAWVFLLKYLIIWKPLSCVFHRIFPMFSIFSPQIANLLCCSTLLVHQGRFYFALFNSFFHSEKILLFFSSFRYQIIPIPV